MSARFAHGSDSHDADYQLPELVAQKGSQKPSAGLTSSCKCLQEYIQQQNKENRSSSKILETVIFTLLCLEAKKARTGII